ncbi:MAG: DNA methylase N-4 [Prevotellaceae bacterium]|jgi:DNA modification methylase|nr:DNA methylase N-4 [Prevotellaceae bacterium]
MNKQKYIDFLKKKIVVAPETGFDMPFFTLTFADGTALKPHQRDAIRWAVKGGRRALFESFGLGKTIQQLIICQSIIKYGYPSGLPGDCNKALIVCPLGVRHEFTRDAKNKLGIDVRYVKTQEEANAAPKGSILITNYERVRDGNINPKTFLVTCLDEASVLRSFGSKTYQTFLDKFRGVKYKFVATATPSPNKYKELIHYAGYLEILDTGQALTRWFKRDSTKANNLTLHPHKEREFWMWVSTWALFLTKPSDLGYSDEGYALPEMNIAYHKIAVDHTTAGVDRDGQVKMFREASIGLKEAAKEKSESIAARIAKVKEIIDNDRSSSYIIWHHREAERHAIMEALPKEAYNIAEVYGSQDMDMREGNIIDFSEGRIQYLATKPEISGQGCNFQYHCHKAIFAGINYEFNAFIQAIHRVHRFQQAHPVEVHVIYMESEGEILKSLQEKWKQHDYLVEQMARIMYENGLSSVSVQQKLMRSLGLERREEKGAMYTAINNDCALEAMNMPDSSVHLICTSIPFSNHYEYTPSYNDFGHNAGNAAFFEQLDFLTPELLRILHPGRLAVVHVKDRILFGNATGTGMPTVDPFSDMTVFHFIKHGFQYMGRITIETDVVRENNQTYRLGYTEKCKDGSKMGVGCPEYLLLFRKLPTDTGKAYADIPVVRPKGKYNRGNWQIDARAKWNSSGNSLLTGEELRRLDIDKVNRRFYEFFKTHTYDYEAHVGAAVALENAGKLPATFETLTVPSRSAWVWDDVNRMITLNGKQTSRNLINHICPLQIDIVDRVIKNWSNEGETVFDPFGGIMTVPYRAVMLGRRGIATELNAAYWRDGLAYLRAAEADACAPTLFDALAQKDGDKIAIVA